MDKKRVYLLDIIRGILIIYVVYYHFMYDLNDIIGKEVPYLYSTWFSTIRDCMSGSLIFISGISCNFSRSNLKRGIRTLGIAMCLTAITYFVMPEQTILFGILHLLGTMMTVYGLGQLISKLIARRKSAAVDEVQNGEHTGDRTKETSDNVKKHTQVDNSVRIILAPILFILVLCTYNIYWGWFGIGALRVALPNALYGSFPMYLCGFRGPFFSADYYPLLPWGLLFMSGAMFGSIFRSENLPEFLYKNFCKPLAFIGRHTMIIYLVHQPLLLGICMLCTLF